ncbi:DUF3885 domain-containing protein [Brevibacillus reuszeri]|uniref:DUF3885 domain-containing protein n=1 Tax=Brevibacillus reuszeri TaxID=54915 RepID=UPI0028986032|nr:DUF3885 domain-containing protein [Brevibacillus reuszeri]
MDSINRLENYLRTNFPELNLEPPLFYHSAVGIRFEIGVPYRGIEHPSYFQTVKMRSIMLFEQIFKAVDEICIVVHTYDSLHGFEVMNEGINVLPTFIRNKNIVDHVDCAELEREYDENGKLQGISYQSCLWCRRDEIDYKRILIAIGYQDFPSFKQPYISDRVYFINPRSHVIYHLYDDRGLDIVSNHPFSIRSLYQKYNNWILDYDRERIENIFKGF